MAGAGHEKRHTGESYRVVPKVTDLLLFFQDDT